MNKVKIFSNLPLNKHYLSDWLSACQFIYMYLSVYFYYRLETYEQSKGKTSMLTL